MRELLLALAATLALPALAGEIVPANPSTFEPVNLRLTVDSCAFVPSTVRVRAADNVITITQHQNNCFVAGPPEVVDIRLGSFPTGDYRVELYPGVGPEADGTPIEVLDFAVRERPEAAAFPPPTRPITDYTGIWWTPSESGWGLSLHQSSSNAMFGAWFVYGANGQPEWFTLQGGRWESATLWTASIYRTTGPFFAGPDYDPRLVLLQEAGTATLDFRQLPGDVGRARFTYTVQGVTRTKVIQRMVF